MPYLTPSAAAGAYLCRRLIIPAEMADIVTGALEKLTHTYSYEQFGAMSVDDAARLMLTTFNDYLSQECGEMIGQVSYFPNLFSHPDWLLCSGGSYLKADYPELAAHLAGLTNYESPFSEDEFLVPQLLGVLPRGVSDVGLLGSFGGADETTLTIPNLPAHGHGSHDHGTHSHIEQDPGLVNIPLGPAGPNFALSDPGLPSQTGSSSVPSSEVEETGESTPFDRWPTHQYLVPYIRARATPATEIDFIWSYPKSATLWWRDAVSNLGAMTNQIMQTQQFATYSQFTGSPANGTYGEIGFHLQAGTYELRALGLTHSAAPIVTWLLDGAGVVASDDWYSAAQVVNVLRTWSVAVSSSGYHKLRVEVIGKNAASSNRQMRLTRIALIPASY